MSNRTNMSNISKRRREGPRTKIKTMGDHKEFLKRITKTLYYGHLPTLPCLSLPVTEISCSVWSETQRGRSLRRLHADAAARVARGACVSPCALVLALLYLERLNACNPDYLLNAAPQDLFLISLMVGNKFLQDDGEDDEVICSEWAASGGIDLKQLNKLELEFLDAIDWNIFVNEESFEAGLSRLERQVALKQARARGFFTYTDLRAACDAARGGELLRACLALTAACAACAAAGAAAVAALLALHACLPLPLPLPLPSDLAPPALHLRLPLTFLNNATVEFAIDALADELEATERLKCCAEWSRRRDEDSRPVRSRRAGPERKPESAWWSRASALGCLYWSSLVNPLQRWLERVTEYAELARRTLGAEQGGQGGGCEGRRGGLRGVPHHCAPQWLNLSKLSALLATVSDR